MNRLKRLFFASKNLKCFLKYIRMENRNYKNKTSERKYLNVMRKNQFLKVENSFLELEKEF